MSPHPLIESLVGRRPILLDGAWGTELQADGLALGATSDFWNLYRPESVEAVARSYVAAGSDVILTNTFQANRIAQAAHADVDRIAEVNRVGVEISKRAAGGRALVFASMGPSGEAPASVGSNADAVEAAFVEQAEALASGGADAIVLETFSDMEEAAMALRAARGTGLPVVVCMLFGTGEREQCTAAGASPEQVAAAFAGADALGANCGAGIAEHVAICARLSAASSAPIWIKPNAGIPTLDQGRPVYSISPLEFAEGVDALIAAGASFVGGCCGTTPRFIELLRQRLGS